MKIRFDITQSFCKAIRWVLCVGVFALFVSPVHADYNWPYGPPPDARPPNLPTPLPDKGPDDDCYSSGSIIACQSQTLGEALTVTGTPFQLHYGSDRVPGRKAAFQINIPVSGATVPGSLIRIDLVISIAGRQFSQSFSPLPNQNTTFIWDGKDVYGRVVQGQAQMTVRVGYVYEPVYVAPAQYPQSFAALSASGVPITNNRLRFEITLWQTFQLGLGVFDFKGMGLGGWSLSPQHVYTPNFKVLYLGDGTRRDPSTTLGSFAVTTVAGNGTTVFSGDGGPAIQASLFIPQGVAVGPDGSFYIADHNHSRVRRVGPDGVITTVAGNGTNAFPFFSGEGGPATQAEVADPNGVAVGPDGSLYISDNVANRIRRVSLDGTITTVAGNGNGDFSGDGGPATQAAMHPIAFAVGPDGSIYITDELADATDGQTHSWIRRIGPDGIINTVAGNGNPGFGGDGGPATQALFFSPSGLAVGPDGSLYIADGGNNRVRRMGPDGIITTVAGNGNRDFSGDGGPATQAAIWSPVSVTVGPDNSLYIVNGVGGVHVRRVGPDGIITTIAGSGISTSTFSGDGGPATLAPFGFSHLALVPDGSLFIADQGYNRIRHIVSQWPSLSSQEQAIPSEDGEELYVFSAQGRHLRTVNSLTGTVRYQFGYDSVGRLISITDGDGNITTIERDGSGNSTAIVAPGGQRTVLTLDTNGYLATVVNPANETVKLSYTADGLLASLTDPKGGQYQYAYDALGRLIQDEDPAGGMKTLARVDATDGHTVTLTTPLGRTTSYQVQYLPTGAIRRINSNSSGAQTVVVINPDGSQTVTDPDGMTTSLTTGPDPRFGMLAPRLTNRVRTLPGGQVETVTGQRTVTLTDPKNILSLSTLSDNVTINGRGFTRIYNAGTRTITDTSAEGRQIVFGLDAQERIISELLAPGLSPITVTYDGQGRMTGQQQGTLFWSFAYDARNRVTSRTDAAGRTLSFAYDDNDRMIRKTLPSGAVYQFMYDLNGNLIHVLLPSGAQHLLQYTAVGLDSSYTPPGNGSYLKAYNLDRQLTRITLPGGRTRDQTYDAAGRVSGLNDADAATSIDYLAGDLTDRAARIGQTPASGPAQAIAYGYNGSLIGTMTATGVSPGQVGYNYDNNFFLTGMTFASGVDSLQTTFAHDRDGLLSIFGPFTFARSGPGGAVSQIGDGTMSTAYAYDTSVRISARTHQVGGPAVYTMNLTYDNAGRIIGKSETVGGTPHTYAYTYNLDGQLTGVTRDGIASEAYGYDPNGNRTSRQIGIGAIEAASYDNQDRLTQLGAVAYKFGSDGFLTQRGSDTFHYNVRGQLTQAVVAGQTISYAYDGLGRRVSRTDGSGMTQYLYGDPSSPIVTAVRSPAGEFTVFYYDAEGLLIALNRSGLRYYVATDQVGTPRVVSNSTGAIMKSLEFDAFGNLVTDSNTAFDLPIGYAGGLADPATGLVHFGSRDYDPAAGRWTARDPVLFEGGQGNLYVYVGNDPINNRDPSGLFCITVTAYDGIGGGVQTCITDQGASVCGEVGIGVGVTVGIDNGGLEKTGDKAGLELTAKCGSAGVGGEVAVDNTGCLKFGPTAQIGPIKVKKGPKIQGKADVEGAPKFKVTTDCSLTGKAYAKGCVQGKF